ncbi:MAG: flagellin, partial [Oscillospiraceae bacterium]|nr:flagellin [Oscillospiraceae bacterium]
MRIQHNIMAMNAYRNYNNNTKALSGNLEKLSSGYKINRAGDDAAGLAISEKMRAQITGLEAAQKNVKDGISLVKTGEGAMQEIQDMLNRMDYLATQSANGTYDNEVDRANLQKEVNALKSEINRIADSANFNGIKLLDGSLAAEGGSAATSVGKIEGVNVVDIDPTKGAYGTVDASPAIGTANGDKITATVSLTDADGKATKEVTVELTIKDAAKKIVTDADGNEYTLATLTAADTSKALAEVLNKNEDIKANFKVTSETTAVNGLVAANGLKFEALEAGASAMQVKAINISTTVAATGATTYQKNGIQGGPGEDSYQTIDITSLKIYEGSDATPQNDGTNKLDRATFTINGKKFAVVDRNKLDDDMKAELKAAGVEHFLDVTGNEWANATNNDLVDAAHKIGMETGLEATLGKTTEDAENTFEADNTVAGADNDRDNGLHVSIALKASTGKMPGGGLTLQIGDTADDFNQMKVSIGDMHTKAMGIANVDISTQDGAAAAIQTIKDAINYVSGVRGDLGAVQNRLEHTQNNLSVMAENIQDAESTIRDTDVAEEMMSYVKNNILVQSAQAMLA